MLTGRCPFVLAIFLKTVNEIYGSTILLFPVRFLPSIKYVLAQVRLQDYYIDGINISIFKKINLM